MADTYLVKNTLWTSQVINLPEGKSVTLPARGSAEMTAKDLSTAACQKLLAEGKITVLSEGKGAGG